MFRSAEPLFRPRSIAIVGASDTGGAGWPKAIYANFEHTGFPAKIYLVNPRREELWGQKVYPDFASLPEPIDLALTIIPAEVIPDTLAEGAAHGLKSALVFAARFGEGGDPDGEARAESLRSLAGDQGLRICGPNCMGSLSLAEKLLLYPAPRVRNLPAGDVGVVFQSGGTFQYWLQQSAARGLGFSYAVSSGNELDLDIADYINFLVEDDSTRMIVCMIEGVRRPDAFMEAAEKALAAEKSILALKIGSSERGRRSTQSHTGALAGDDDVFNAVCRKYGIVRCPSLDDLIETAIAFRLGRVPDGNRVAMAGYSGGAKGLFLDYASAAGLELAEFAPATQEALSPLLDPGLKPENPLDTGAGLAGQPAKFAEICAIIARDPGVDVLSMQGQLPTAEGDRLDPAMFAGTREAGPSTTIIAHGRMAHNVTPEGRALQEQAGVPFLQGLPETVGAIKALTEFGECRRRGISALPPETGDRAALEGDALDSLLREHGLTPPLSDTGATSEAAASAAERIGFPVALKIVSPQASHKTEVGGVALNLRDEVEVHAEAEAMAARLKHADPEAEIEGYLVQEMVDGLEFILGVRRDPQFGPFMVAGLGGILVEAVKDVSFRLLPVSEADARAMLGELKAKALLGAFRGRPARDVDALVKAMCGLSAIYADHRSHMTDIEINPLIVLEDGAGVRAVDVRIVR